MAKSKRPENCPACNSAPNSVHRLGCDVERCAQCGRQLLSCPHSATPPPDDSRMHWTGEWPGVVECCEFGWFTKQDPSGRWVPCDPGDPGAEPDLNRLQKEAHWDPQQRRYIKGQDNELDDVRTEQAKKAVVAFLTENYPQVAAVEIRYDGALGQREIADANCFDAIGPSAKRISLSDQRLEALVFTLCYGVVPAEFDEREGGEGTIWLCTHDLFHAHINRNDDDND